MRYEQEKSQDALKAWVFVKSSIQKIQSNKIFNAKALNRVCWTGFDSATC